MKTTQLFFLFLFVISANSMFAQTKSKNSTNDVSNINSFITYRKSVTAFNRDVKIFPEDITSYLYVYIAGVNSGNARVIIKDDNGRTVLTNDVLIGQTEKFSVKQLPRGIYNISITINGLVVKKQLITLI